MKAVVFKSAGQPLEVADLPDPVAAEGEIVVKVKNCGVCGSDLHAVKYGFNMPPGTVMGHEFSAVIDHVGPGVTGYAPGERVVVMSYLACGKCDSCKSGHGSRCRAMRLVGFGDVGGAYAEKMKTTPGSIFRMPANLSHRAAATVEPLVVGLHGVHRAGLRAGESCLIMGAGPIGLVTLLWARFAGASAIVVSEMAEGRRAMALKMGADVAVDPRVKNPADELQRITGAPPDVVFECIGARGTMAEAITFSRRGGRVVVIGVCMEEDSWAPIAAMNKELDLRFSLGLEPGEIEMAIAMLAAGRVDTSPMITDIVSLGGLPAAFSALAHPNLQTKVMLEL
ncbi:MAG TPA: alcohol dehydrogenase catalytic domain-containing protein [Candidatus Acidoferrales bacterium]|nr:alcohol dehydrogenase catalytic domain-containing protein [Candidatus Acidoferrales bacterium]